MTGQIEDPEVLRARWARLRQSVAERFPFLIAVIDAAGSFPEVSSLCPFVSLDRICLSRCTEYPYDVDFLFSFRDAVYFAEATLGHGGWVETKRIGAGSAKDVVALVASLIPPDYGPARRGTADGLPPSPLRMVRR